MSRFKNIDNKLDAFADKLNAKLTKNRANYPEALSTFEERRIDWVGNQIRKAVIIQPTFEVTGVNSSIWNFINVAWIEKDGVALKPGWNKKLVEEANFNEIENNIDELLLISEQNLKKVKTDDLR